MPEQQLLAGEGRTRAGLALAALGIPRSAPGALPRSGKLPWLPLPWLPLPALLPPPAPEAVRDAQGLGTGIEPGWGRQEVAVLMGRAPAAGLRERWIPKLGPTMLSGGKDLAAGHGVFPCTNSVCVVPAWSLAAAQPPQPFPGQMWLLPVKETRCWAARYAGRCRRPWKGAAIAEPGCAHLQLMGAGGAPGGQGLGGASAQLPGQAGAGAQGGHVVDAWLWFGIECQTFGSACWEKHLCPLAWTDEASWFFLPQREGRVL